MKRSVPKAVHNACVHSVPREKIAEQRIFAVRGAAADGVCD
jgi:hypothetical protein